MRPSIHRVEEETEGGPISCIDRSGYFRGRFGIVRVGGLVSAPEHLHPDLAILDETLTLQIGVKTKAPTYRDIYETDEYGRSVHAAGVKS